MKMAALKNQISNGKTLCIKAGYFIKAFFSLRRFWLVYFFYFCALAYGGGLKGLNLEASIFWYKLPYYGYLLGEPSIMFCLMIWFTMVILFIRHLQKRYYTAAVCYLLHIIFMAVLVDYFVMAAAIFSFLLYKN